MQRDGDDPAGRARLGRDPQYASEVVAAPAGQHAEHGARNVAQTADDASDQAVASERDRDFAGARRRVDELAGVRDVAYHLGVKRHVALAQRRFDLRQHARGAAAARGGVAQQGASEHGRPLDVGDVDGHAFIGIASLGFDSDANRIANGAPSRLGKLVCVYGGLRALAAWKPARFELRLDGEPHTFSGYTVAAANSSSYGGGMKIAPAAVLDDGLLDVVLIAAHSKAGFLRTLPKVFKGAHVEHPAVRVERVRELHVDADRLFVIYADGDPVGETPATIRVTPGAVTVLAPA